MHDSLEIIFGSIGNPDLRIGKYAARIGLIACYFKV